MGAALAWSGPARATRTGWRERRDLYPEGVASGDPAADSVILWTRRPFDERRERHAHRRNGDRRRLSAASSPPRPRTVSAASDWTCRVLVAGLRPARVYWYRFTDAEGNGSRIGRTITAPADDDPRAGQFRLRQLPEHQRRLPARLAPDDLGGRARPRAEQLGFVLHLGDFIYEVVQYPEDMPDPLRPDDRRHRPRAGQREGRQFPRAPDCRGLSRHLPRLSPRSRHSGRPRPLAVRGDVGQSRILLAGLAEHR